MKEFIFMVSDAENSYWLAYGMFNCKEKWLSLQFAAF